MATGVQIGDVWVPGRVLTAPMTGITDLPFRRVASALGAPYVATEMVAAAELARARPDVVRRAAVGDGLPLTVIQLVGRDPGRMAEGAAMAQRAGADIIDLNYGCPAKEVTGAACGSALMRTPDLACRLMEAAVNATSRPVTVKMRLGWDDASRNAPELARRAEAIGVKAVTVHGRTRQQFYTGVADWAAIRRVRDAIKVPLVVNGDIGSLHDAEAALAASGADAVMVGRAHYGAPWLASAIAGAPNQQPATPQTAFEYVVAHYDDMLALYGREKGLRHARKHLGWYLDRFALEVDTALRTTIMTAVDPTAVITALRATFLSDGSFALEQAA